MRYIHYLFAFLILSGVSCSTHTHIADIDTSYYRMSYKVESDSDIDAMVEPYKSQLDAKMSKVLAYNPEKMSRARPSSDLGNWFADVLLEISNDLYSNVDVAFQNYGGIRIPTLGKGDVTVGKIYELMPFDNTLVVIDMSGKELMLLLNRIAEKGGWPISSTCSFTIKHDKAVDVIIHEKSLDPSGQYRVALPDYIANGGDKCDFLIDMKRQDKSLLIRDLLVEYLSNLKGDDRNIKKDNTIRIRSAK